ncbi:MAG: hypothetical protein ABI566_03405 [Pseudolysinimonas sp.]
MRGSGTTWGAAILATGLAFALAGCAPGAPTPQPTASSSASAGSETAAPAAPELNPQGTATDNLPYFDATNNALIASGGGLDGRSFIDNLVNAGFSKAAMEVTPDRTTVNAQADQIQFSVRINGTCLVGQYGAGEYNSAATAVLGDGRCLIGTTRPIDW